MHAPERLPQTAWIQPFLPNDPEPPDALWHSERTPWSARLVSRYLEEYSRPGDLVLDPFAGQSVLARQAAGSQRRLLLSHYSPATVLSVLTSAMPPEPGVLDAAFTRIADAPRRGQPLSQYLNSLYETICPECAQTITAGYYVWNRAAGEPVQKGYACPHCRSAGQVATDMADVELTANLEVRGAAYWGLMSRLVASDDPLTPQARSLLELYTPRALVAINELITAIDQRLAEPDQRQAARALTLHVLQRCLAQPVPGTSPPTAPDQLPGQFIEHNVWLAFDHARSILHERAGHTLPLVTELRTLLSPTGPGSVLLRSTALPELAGDLEPGSVSLVLSEPPSFDPSAYSMNFLWTGWIFGREAAVRLRSTLSITDWGWDWYARAMAASMRSLAGLLRRDGHLVLAFSDPSARRPLALLTAAAQAGLQLVAGAAQVPQLAGAELPAWRLVFSAAGESRATLSPAAYPDALRLAAQEAARSLVDQRGEPASLPLVNTAVAVRWEEMGLLAAVSTVPDAARRPVSYLVDQARLALAPELAPPGLRFYPPGDREQQARAQWAAEHVPETLAVADRAERHVATLLAEGVQSPAEIQTLVYERMPGWQTPDAALLAACLASYSAQEESGRVVLRPEDQPARRARERGETLLRLHALGHRLGYQVWVAPQEQSAALGLVPLGKGGPYRPEDWVPAGLVWHQDGRPTHAFALALQATLHPWLEAPPEALGGCPRYAVVPGGRAGLLDFKLRRCPAWRDRLAWTGWEFVKFRHIRHLAALPGLDLAGFRARIGLDPVLTLPGAQLALFQDSGEGEDHGN